MPLPGVGQTWHPPLPLIDAGRSDIDAGPGLRHTAAMTAATTHRFTRQGSRA